MEISACGHCGFWPMAMPHTTMEGNTEETRAINSKAETKDKDGVKAVPIESMASHQELNPKTLRLAISPG